MSRTTRIRMRLESLESRRVLATMPLAVDPVELPTVEPKIEDSLGSIVGDAAYVKTLDFDGDGDVDAVDALTLRKAETSELETKPMTSAIIAEKLGEETVTRSGDLASGFETAAYGSKEGEEAYSGVQDFDNDGDIDGIDLLKFRAAYVSSPSQPSAPINLPTADQ